MGELKKHEMIGNENFVFIEKLYQELSPTLLTSAEAVLGKKDLAETALQETFILAMQNSAALKASPNPPGWIFNTMKNVMMHIRRDVNLVSQRVVSLEELPEEPAGYDTYHEGPGPIESTSLADEDTQLLNRYYLEGIPLKELSAELGISESACKMRVKRARDKIRRKHSADDF